MVTYAVRVDKLSKRYREVVAVDDISFAVREGEVYGLLGPNGAGKTTTLHILATILKPSSGSAYVAGYDVVEEPDKVRKKIGMVFQDPTLDDQLTAYDNMYIHGRLYGLKGGALKSKISELLDFVGLKDFAHRQVKYFSGGMKRRLEIARSLLHEPRVLFLDEPTIGLDPQTRIRIWDYIMRVRKEKNVTVLLTTHYMDEAEELCDRIAIMDKGKVVAEGTAESLKSLIGSEVIYLRFGRGSHIPRRCLEAEFVIKCNMVGDNLMEVIVKDAPTAIPKLLELISEEGVEVSEISYRRPTLNEVFIHLTGRELRDSLNDTSFPRRFMGRWR